MQKTAVTLWDKCVPVCIYLEQKKEMPGSLALCSKYLSAFFYSFKCRKWIDVYRTQPAAVPSLFLFCTAPPLVLQKRGLDRFSIAAGEVQRG